MNTDAAYLASKADDNLPRHFQAEPIDETFSAQAYQEWNVTKASPGILPPPRYSFINIEKWQSTPPPRV